MRIAFIALVLLCANAILAQDIGWEPLPEDLIFGPVYVGPKDDSDAKQDDPDDATISPSVAIIDSVEENPLVIPKDDSERSITFQDPRRIPDPRKLLPSPLTEIEIEYARTAWSYFTHNTHPETGLVPSVRRFKSMTLWDEGGYLLALTSAHRLGLISRIEATDRLSKVLNSLAHLPLLDVGVPNKAYNIETLEMTDYANRPQPDGVGCSALDIMRLMSGLLVVTQEFPEFIPFAQLVVDRWDLAVLTKKKRLACFVVKKNRKEKWYVKLIEGRIGYEQYAGVTARELGLNAPLTFSYKPILRWQQYFDIRIPGDIRNAASHGVSSVTTSEPFLLEALEYGWRDENYEVTLAVFKAQHHRFKRTGQLTSLSEDHIKGAPYFAYNGILVDNEPFVSVTAGRKDVSHKRGISTKASFGWWALTRHPYTLKLLEAISSLQTEEGWYAGLFEADMSSNEILTLNTNAMILEALHYKAFGPLYHKR